MDHEHLSPRATPMSGSFMTETTHDVADLRGEEILGLPVVKDKTWNIEATVSPAEAKAILLAMPPQRPLSPANVRYFRELILAKRFKITHQGIAFDKDGKLLDGMHRLTACAEADAAICVQVTFNMDREVFDALDRGRARSQADDLVCGSIVQTPSEANIMSSASKILWLLDNGKVPWAHPLRHEFMMPDMRKVIERHPFVFDCASFVYRNQKAWRGIGMGPATALYTKFREASWASADEFMKQVALGEYIGSGDPAYAFREFKKFMGSASGIRVRAAGMIALTRCWNAFVEGRRLTKVASAMRSDSDANFPVISRGK